MEIDVMIIFDNFSLNHVKLSFPQRKSCCYSVAKSCPALCDPMNYSMPGFPILHYLQEFARTHVHWVDDAIQPSHPLSSSFSLPSPSVFNLSKLQGLFQWVGSSHQMAKELELQLQHQSFQWIFTVDFLKDWLVWSCCPRDSQESSSTPQFKASVLACSAFFMVQLSHHTWLLEKP